VIGQGREEKKGKGGGTSTIAERSGGYRGKILKKRKGGLGAEKDERREEALDWIERPILRPKQAGTKREEGASIFSKTDQLSVEGALGQR